MDKLLIFVILSHWMSLYMPFSSSFWLSGPHKYLRSYKYLRFSPGGKYSVGVMVFFSDLGSHLLATKQKQSD